jgi:ribonucleoside-diphosphate reductase alpha chain
MLHTDVALSVRKRDGRVVSFERVRIEQAITKAFRAELGLASEQALTPDAEMEIQIITDAVVERAASGSNGGVDVERIQDTVEIQMMRRGHYAMARRYIVYREEHAKARALRSAEQVQSPTEPRFFVVSPDGSRAPFDPLRIRRRVRQACAGFESVCHVDEIIDEVFASVYDGITPVEIDKALILATRSRIERDPAYDTAAARLLLRVVLREALEYTPEGAAELERAQRLQFAAFIRTGIFAERLAPVLMEFNLAKLAAALKPERDGLFDYQGMQTIYDRYLLHVEGRRIETPQYFWMRVAMGLAVNEGALKDEKAIEFYNLLSSFRFTSATPTLFNAGTLHPQLSSCYLSTVNDDLGHIFKVVGDNARLSKWAGGLGNDWTNIRSTGAHIKGTNGQSQGVIPFLKVVNDTAVAVNQGGKRKGAVCSYLETWHLDIEEFLDLRKNTGDDRRRTHDMHTANWIPDLFMKRVEANGTWTLFSPHDVPDLHDLYGQAFERRYIEYERRADDGRIKLYKRISAVELWRKMLSRLFESGHPWITFKDPSNIRSPQDHVGVVHSSNLCTEILLNTSAEETAVCNLGSVNLGKHMKNGALDLELLENTIRTAVRMLDNVIDINFYPTPEAKTSNTRHRPIGLGLMGFQDALYMQGISYASPEAVEFADRSMEAISYYAILASTELARERGTYPTYNGSKWSRGMLPIDTVTLLEEQRGEAVQMDRGTSLDWNRVRNAVKQHGMRNSNVMAIAPTATISTIIGCSQSIEPAYRNLYAKSNLSGDFTQINVFLVDDLKKAGLWDEQMIAELKYHDGQLGDIARIPAELKQIYVTAFDVETHWVIECASRRQKWIDQGQSLNLYMAEPNGKKLHDMYTLAWKTGLKTTYYLRCLGATQVEKSTLDVNRFGIQPKWMKNKSASSDVQLNREPSAALAPKACSIDNPSCESCQ